MKYLAAFLMLIILPVKAFTIDCFGESTSLMEDIWNPCLNKFFSNWDAEIRGAYFQPVSRTQNSIYTRDHLTGGIEVAKRLDCNWSFWANYTYIRNRGNNNLGENTTLRLNPLSMGIKYAIPIGCRWKLYAGIGPNYTWGRIWENGNPPRHTNRSKVGLMTKLGLNYELENCLFVDIFADYLYMPMQFHNLNNASGFLFGLGLGIHL